MIINCGKRRLVSYRYGWKIEASKTNQYTGEQYWTADHPAWPASLEDALQAICLRELADMQDITIDGLPDALKSAVATVRRYLEQARSAA